VRHVTLTATLFFLLACSSPGQNSGDNAGTAGAGFQHDFVVSMSLTVPPGTELYRCQYVKLGNANEVELSTLAHQYTPGSHHMLVWDTDLTGIPADMTGLYDCIDGDEPIYQHATERLYGAQLPKGYTTLPDGVGLRMTANHVLMLTIHFLNPTQEEVAATVSFGADLAKGPVTTHAGLLHYSDPFIYLPLRAKASTGLRCTIPQDITLVSGFSHYHQHGLDMRAFSDPSTTSESLHPIYTSNDWQHPVEIQAGTVLKGGSVFRFICDYDNTAGNTEIFYGPNSLTSEMCVFMGLYYPKIEEPDFSPPSVMGFGKKACRDVERCLVACPAGAPPQALAAGTAADPCWERCVASGCDGAVDAAFASVQCTATHCALECGAGLSAACQSCVAGNCDKENQGCMAHTCK
jgi:hypothetical protein